MDNDSADTVNVSEQQINGRDGTVLVRDYRPTTPRSRTPFLWVHGGGFTSGGLDQKESDAPARALCAAGTHVRTLQYRLAPRAYPWKEPNLRAHPGRYPSGLDDVVDTISAMVTDSGGPINLGGASAGANLAAAATLRLRDEGAPMPGALALAYGTFHAVLPPNDQIEGELRGMLAKWAFNATMLRRMNLNYVGDPALLVPGYPFPGGADLDQFPPTLIMDAANDRLRRSGHAFADELRAAGTVVREIVLPGTHAVLNAPRSDGFAQGIKALKTWLSEHD